MSTTILLGFLALFACVQMLRYRCAFLRATKEAEQVVDDYQDLGRVTSEESDRYEAALVHVAQFPYDDVKKIATEALTHTGTIKLMKIYAPERHAEWEAECQRRAAIDKACKDAAASFRARCAEPCLLQRFCEGCVEYVITWWNSPR